MKVDRRAIVRGAILAASLGLLLAWCTPGHMLIEIPDGYRGPVVIFFGHPNGTTPGWNWARRVYRVPEDGVLRIKSKLRWRRWNEEWVFVSGQGTRAPIPSFDDDELRDASITRAGKIHNIAASQGDRNWIQALIVVPADRETVHENPHFVVSRVKTEIERIEAGRK
jgi:hypothetical protein